MSHNPAPTAPFQPPPTTSVGGGGVPPGGDGSPPGDTTTTGETLLPFTGSVFTAPIAFLGLVLTFAGWVVLRLGLRED
jgi:hypothetical protein